MTNRIRECGKVEGLDGERLAVGIEDDTVAIYVGDWLSADGCRLNAAQAEEFAALFVHAVWQAASLGASFEPATDPDCDECGFGLPRHDKDCSHYREPPKEGQ